MNQLEFETRLKEVYNGAVKPLNKYINERAIIYFKCESCGLRFFGKPSYVVGKDHQRHACNKPYGTAGGHSTVNVSAVKTSRKGKKKDSGKVDIEALNKMIWEDYTYQQIASELKINPKIVKEYFKSAGLI